ncbi:type IV pilus assembly protein PilO [Geothermobacter ehrlichii]|uniref:Type IV pilus assembly protein PilO n=1 Tax=Geothermobacter ehrlichii TaxID=213224 RepID=A0A5D3WQT9_9BACT|nr:type 4a pilus biogenesis protein PilO [Geothermobacter ehrlichii]TYO99958.1 type IV pilus assembly protein PilO [Geothermobacter ehrlichii]
MNPTVEKILKLPAYQRVLLLFLVLALIVGAFVWFLFLPQQDELKRLQAENQRLQVRLQQDQRIANNLPKFRAEYEKMKKRLEEALTELPNRQEIPSLLTSIAAVAKDNGLDVVRFQPGGEVNRGFYAEVPVSLRLSGTYHQVALFSYAVSKLPRIVNLHNLSLKPARGKGGQTILDISCTAVTFRFVEKAPKGKKK